MKNNRKTAVILFNLGGPSNIGEVRSFLFSLFYDKYIIRLPNPFRWIIAKIISNFRNKTAIEIYEKIGGKSPILEETEKQRIALEKYLNNKNIKIFISMRYSSPRSSEIIKEIEKDKPDNIILLPLYPHFSTTTTKSSIEDMVREIKKINFQGNIKTICCYPDFDGFIDSYVKNINIKLKELKNKENFRILFSAHGLPQKIIDNGDPYQWQIEESVKKIVKNLQIKDLDYKVTYQSRVGPVRWLEPYTDKEIKAACEKKKSIIIAPIAFVSEHSETLVELDIEYAKIAEDVGIEYLRVATPGSDAIFIDGLAEMVKSFLDEEDMTTSYRQQRLCPEKFNECICK